MDATLRQPLPQGTGADVATLVAADFSSPYVRSDLLTRLDEMKDRSSGRLCFLAFLLAMAVRAQMNLDSMPESVIADIEARVQVGAKKYGERLTSHNGRDALLDAYQELLDAVNYLRQKQHEETGQ